MKIRNNIVVNGSGVIQDSMLRIDKIYNFPENAFITGIQIGMKPIDENTPIFFNVPHDNIIQISNTADSSTYRMITVEQGAYSLDELCATINDYCADHGVQVDILLEGPNYGRAQFTVTRKLKLNLAPDLARIFKLNTNDIYGPGIHLSDDIIDITTGNQTISIYSSIIKSAIQNVANSRNNLLCTFSIKELMKANTQTYDNVFIPVKPYNNFIDFYLTSSETNEKIDFNAILNVYMNVSIIEPELKNDVVDDAIQTDLENVTVVTIPVEKPETTIDFVNTVNLPKNSYITRLSVLADCKIHNIVSRQVLKVNGAQIVFEKGSYDVDTIMEKLNSLNATFNLIIEGKDCYKIEITDFDNLDFREAPELQSLLGINESVIQGQQIKEYYLVDDHNDFVSTDRGDFRLTHGRYYSKNEYMDMFVDCVYKKIGIRSVNTCVNSSEGCFISYRFVDHMIQILTDSKVTFNANCTCNKDSPFGGQTMNGCGCYRMGQTEANRINTIEIPYTINGVSYKFTRGGIYSCKSLAEALRDHIYLTGASNYFVRPDTTNTYLAPNSNNYASAVINTPKNLGITCRNGNVRREYLIDWYVTKIPEDNYIRAPSVCNIVADCVIEGETRTFEDIQISYNGGVISGTYYIAAGEYTCEYLVRGFVEEVNRIATSLAGTSTTVLSKSTHTCGLVRLNSTIAMELYARDANGNVVTLEDYLPFPVNIKIGNNFIAYNNRITVIYANGFYTPESFSKKLIDDVNAGAGVSILGQYSRSNVYANVGSRNAIHLTFNNVPFGHWNKIRSYCHNSEYYWTGVVGAFYKEGEYFFPNVQNFQDSCRIWLFGTQYNIEWNVICPMQEMIDGVNRQIADKGVEFKKTNNGWQLVSGSPIGFTCDQDFITATGATHTDYTIVIPYRTIKYEISGSESYTGDRVVNITNNKEIANIYCNIVKTWQSGALLLSQLHVVDLEKNYSSTTELIPVKESFNSIYVKVSDLAGNNYSFAGTIYLVLQISSVN